MILDRGSSIEAFQVASELLKMKAESNEERAMKVQKGLTTLAFLDQRKSGSNASRRADHLSPFLETHVLGIISSYAIIINDVQMSESNLEKRRCLAAIGELMRLGKSNVKSALPQLCACLRTALEIDDLCGSAFDAWCCMVSNLDEKEKALLIDQTMALTIKIWSKLSQESQQKAQKLMSDLIKEHFKIVAQIVESLPSLSSIPLLAEIENQLSVLREKSTFSSKIVAFRSRLDSENISRCAAKS